VKIQNLSLRNYGRNWANDTPRGGASVAGRDADKRCTCALEQGEFGFAAASLHDNTGREGRRVGDKKLEPLVQRRHDG